MTLRAVIFDVDGTLAETEEAHRQAFNETFAAQGLGWHWTQADYKWLLKTTGGKERIRAYLRHLGQPEDSLDVPALHAAKTARYVQILEQGGLELCAGIADLVAATRAAGLKVACATTTSRPNVEALCQCCWGQSADQVFDVVGAGDEVPHKKPAPDVYLLALERLGMQPGETIALEDSLNGVNSARAAGVPVLVTPSIYTQDEDFGDAPVLMSAEMQFLPEELRAVLGVTA